MIFGTDCKWLIMSYSRFKCLSAVSLLFTTFEISPSLVIILLLLLLSLFLLLFLLDSGNCRNSCENEEIKIKVKAKEVKVWDQERFSFSNVYACNLSYVFMDEMNLLYWSYVLEISTISVTVHETKRMK